MLFCCQQGSAHVGAVVDHPQYIDATSTGVVDAESLLYHFKGRHIFKIVFDAGTERAKGQTRDDDVRYEPFQHAAALRTRQLPTASILMATIV